LSLKSYKSPLGQNRPQVLLDGHQNHAALESLMTFEWQWHGNSFVIHLSPDLSELPIQPKTLHPATTPPPEL
jgi:hypothetical protein